MNVLRPCFCTRCGSALHSSVEHSFDRSCPRCYVYSPGARIVVACCVMRDERMLWIRRGLAPRRGFWAIPTGFLDSGETPAQGAAREVLEETGITLCKSELQLHGLGSVPHMNEVYIVFRARISDDVQPTPSEEALEARFFTESELPWAEIAFPSINYLVRLTYADMRRGHHGVYLTQHDRESYIDQS